MKMGLFATNSGAVIFNSGSELERKSYWISNVVVKPAGYVFVLKSIDDTRDTYTTSVVSLRLVKLLLRITGINKAEHLQGKQLNVAVTDAGCAWAALIAALPLR